MLKRDYVMDLIEQFSRVVAEVIGLGRAAQISEAWEEVGDAAEEYLGLTRKQLASLPALDLLAFVHTGQPEPDIARWHLLVELLFASGELSRAAEQEQEAVRYYLRALDAATEVAREPERLPYFMPAIEKAMASLSAYVFPENITQKLIVCLEMSEQFSVAEDVLFDLLEQSENDPSVVEAGLAFYDRLLRLSDYRLQSGGLPREEVEEGLAELLALQSV